MPVRKLKKCSLLIPNYLAIKTFEYLKRLLLVLLIFSCNSVNGTEIDAKENQPQFKFVDLFRNNKDVSEAQTIIQSSDGFIWYGNYFGLYRFDGISLKRYFSKENSPSILHNVVVSLYEDSKGFIWIGYQNAGLTKYNPKDESFSHFVKGGPNEKRLVGSSVNQVVEDNYGNIWIATNKGLNKYIASSNTIIAFEDTLIANSDVLSLAYDDSGQLWIGTVHGLFLAETNQNKIVFSKIPITSKESEDNPIKVSSLLADGHSLWIGTLGHGVYKTSVKNVNAYQILKKELDWSTTNVRDIKRDKNENIWYATDKGLVFFQNINSQTYVYHNNNDHQNHLYSNDLRELLVDQQNNILIAESGASIQIINTQSAAFEHVLMIKEPGGTRNEIGVHMVAFDKEKNIWLGGIASGLYQSPENKLKFSHHQPNSKSLFSLIKTNPMSMLHDSKYRYWVGTFSNGLLKIDLDLKKKSWYTHDTSKPNSFSDDDRIGMIFEDSLQRIWIGSQDGLNLYRENTNDFKSYLSSNNNENKEGYRITAINETFQGDIIVGTGVGRVFILLNSNDTFEEVSIKNLKGSKILLNYISGIKIKENIIWIADYGVGILRGGVVGNKEGNQVFNGELFNGNHGLNETTVNSIYFDLDDDNTLWLNTDVGISKFEILNTTFFNFTDSDGVKRGTSWTHCNTQTSNGDIYYCGPNGIMKFTPKNIEINRTSPIVILTNFYINSKTVDPQYENNDSVLTKRIGNTSNLLLADTQNNFAFDFAALDYTDPIKNKYAYKLEGFDEEWLTTDAKRRHANYSNVPAGNYTFKVKASNNHGFWNETGAQVKITVLPVWWLTWWMKVIYFGLFISTILWIIRLRTQQHKQLSLALEKAVSERTYELEQKTQDLEARSRSLKTAQKTIIAQEKMSSLGTLTAGVAHEINNPTNFTYAAVYMMKDEITNIKLFLKQLAGGENAEPEVLKSFDDKFSKLVDLANTATEGTNRIKTIVSDLRTYSRLDDAVKEKVQLASILASTIHLVRTQYDNIDITIDITSDPELECFPAKLSQVFMNITVNACQAIMSRKQSEPDICGEVSIVVNLNNDLIEIVFTDNGCGMNSVTQKKIFDPFYTTKDVGDGTGLGMAISFGIIEDHSGTLKVSSVINEGSIITICLPVK